MVLGSWKQLAHLNGSIFLLDHFQKNQYSIVPLSEVLTFRSREVEEKINNLDKI